MSPAGGPGVRPVSDRALTDSYLVDVSHLATPPRGTLLISRLNARRTDEVGARPSASMPAPLVSVVVPARNEAANLPHVLTGIPDGVHEVILVDGHSVDGTVETARRVRPGIRVIAQTRKGKGNALACGFAAATGDVIVMIDADGSTDPQEIGAYVDALHAGADFAKGTRFALGGGSS